MEKKKEELTITSEDMKLLLKMTDDMCIACGLVSKVYAVSVVLREALESERDISVSLGRKVLSDAADVVCECCRDADKAVSEVFELIDRFHKDKSQIFYA